MLLEEVPLLYQQDPDPDNVAIDGLPLQLPGRLLEHEKPLSTASASTQFAFLEAVGWAMQVLP